MKLSRLYSTVLVALMVAVLAACGGGGGGNSGGSGGGSGGGGSGGSDKTSEFTLTASVTGNGNVSDADGQIACGSGGSKCSANYPSGTVVALTATPDEYHIFTGWSNDCGSASGSTSFSTAVAMNSVHSCHAQFTLATYPLTVTVGGDGSGSVKSDPGTINCATGNTGACSASYDANTSVTLTAIEGTGVFAGWGGVCSASTGNTAVVKMNQAQSCSATFNPAPPPAGPYTLTVNVGTGGRVSETNTSSPKISNCASACNGSYVNGTPVTLTATANEGYSFAGWSGSTCSASGNPATITMNADRSCTAAFTPNNYTLTVNFTGTGAGTVTDNLTPHKINNCSSACSGSYATGTQVTLTAAPTGNSTFNKWTGCSSINGASATANIVNAPITCTVQFDPPPPPSSYMLNITVTGNSGSGSVKADSGPIDCQAGNTGTCSGSYTANSTVTLTATVNAGAGHSFGSWGGNCTPVAGSSPPQAKVAMTAASSCTASFTGEGTPGTGTATNETIPVSGYGTRSYTIYKPSNYNTAGKTFPLILVFHGDGNTGSGYRSDFGVNQGFEKIAEMNGGAIIVYPTASPQWKQGDTTANLAKDVDFVDAIVTSLTGEGSKVTPGQVFVTGSSRGAYFIPDLVLHSKTAFKGMVTHAGSNANTNVTWKSSLPVKVDGEEFWYPTGTNGSLNQPMAALQISGMNDYTVGVGFTNNLYLRDTWRAGNQCDDSITPVPYDPSPCVAYQGCKKPEVWCPIPGLEHEDWYYPSTISGVSQAAYVTWKFFSQQK
jgi:poly(3-hydroxybutyrate) depolymerase